MLYLKMASMEAITKAQKQQFNGAFTFPIAEAADQVCDTISANVFWILADFMWDAKDRVEYDEAKARARNAESRIANRGFENQEEVSSPEINRYRDLLGVYLPKMLSKFAATGALDVVPTTLAADFIVAKLKSVVYAQAMEAAEASSVKLSLQEKANKWGNKAHQVHGEIERLALEWAREQGIPEDHLPSGFIR